MKGSARKVTCWAWPAGFGRGGLPGPWPDRFPSDIRVRCITRWPVAVTGRRFSKRTRTGIDSWRRWAKPARRPVFAETGVAQRAGQGGPRRGGRRAITGGGTAIGLSEAALAGLSRGAAPKVVLAWWLRQPTAVPLRRVSECLAMGHYTRVTQAVSRMNRAAGVKAASAAAQAGAAANWRRAMKQTGCHISRTGTFPTAVQVRPLTCLLDVTARVDAVEDVVKSVKGAGGNRAS